MDDLDDVTLPRDRSEGATGAADAATDGNDGSSTDTSSSSDSSDSDSDSDSETEADGAKVQLKFRNYRPFDPKLQQFVVPPASAAADLAWLNEEVNAVVARARASDTALLNIAPRPADWDLARDAAPRLAVLAARTRRAIALAVRDKIRAANAGNNATSA